jgi:hypothetical protein
VSKSLNREFVSSRFDQRPAQLRAFGLVADEFGDKDSDPVNGRRRVDRTGRETNDRGQSACEPVGEADERRPAGLRRCVTSPSAILCQTHIAEDEEQSEPGRRRQPDFQSAVVRDDQLIRRIRSGS